MSIIQLIKLYFISKKRIKYSESEMEMRRYIAGMILMKGAKK